MPLLRIALGYKTEHRNSEPEVIGTGASNVALQAHVEAASAEFRRFEFGTFAFARKARRNGQAPEPSEDAIDLSGAPSREDMLAAIHHIAALEHALSASRATNDALKAAFDAQTSTPPQQASRDAASGETPVPTSEAESDAPSLVPGDDDGPRLPRKGR